MISQDFFHVVLVEPGDSLNVGSVARAMMNLGFSHLHLVAPPRYDPERAAVSACWAGDLLERAQIHQTLESALSPMEHVVGFSTRRGKNRPLSLLLPEWNARISGKPRKRTALVFGPEDHGLRWEHLSHCRWLIRIPSSEANPSYNLSQAVLLVLFELSRNVFETGSENSRRPAPASDFYQLDALVESVLTGARFYKEGTPAPLPEVVKQLFRRIDPDRREIQILLGIFGKLDRVIKGKVPAKNQEGENNPKRD